MYLTQLTLPFTHETQELLARFVRNRYEQHQMLWGLTGASPDAKRDFLYRADVIEGGLRILVLSSKPFERIDEPWVARIAEYRPAFEAQQRLAFRLRFSPMVSLATKRGERGSLTNLVEQIRRDCTTERTLEGIVNEATHRWLGARAEAAGFALNEYVSSNYQNASAVQHRSQNRYLVPSIDVEGVLTITDPETFLTKQTQGIGRARHAGCGLLLTKPIHVAAM